MAACPEKIADFSFCLEKKTMGKALFRSLSVGFVEPLKNFFQKQKSILYKNAKDGGVSSIALHDILLQHLEYTAPYFSNYFIRHDSRCAINDSSENKHSSSAESNSLKWRGRGGEGRLFPRCSVRVCGAGCLGGGCVVPRVAANGISVAGVWCLGLWRVVFRCRVCGASDCGEWYFGGGCVVSWVVMWDVSELQRGRRDGGGVSAL